jgi:RNA polymerase sigma-70 factor (ECF subfamily)
VEPTREERFRVLAHRFAPDVGAFLRRRSYPLSEADVEELLQSVFVVAWRRLDDMPVDKELPWLISAARNLMNNARRSHSRRQALRARITPRGDEPSAEDFVIADDSLRGALKELSASDRELLLLHYWEGLEATDIAIVLGISPGAAATRLSRAASRLRASYSAADTTSVSKDVDRT